MNSSSSVAVLSRFDDPYITMLLLFSFFTYLLTAGVVVFLEL